jgi:prepilin signal peptidase PulO-like enzyme (type II secretory pathway)
MFKGRCRTCKSHVSFQYPLVELFTAALFVGVYALYAPLVFINPTLFIFKVFISLIVMSLLVLITVYDMKHKIIPDAFAYAFAVVAFVAMFVQVGLQGTVGGLPAFSDLSVAIPPTSHLFAGIILAFPFYFLWLISRGQWMGLGDAKLALGIGWFLGLAKGGTAIIYGFWIGALLSILIIISRPETSSIKRFFIIFVTTFVIGIYTLSYYTVLIFVALYAVYGLAQSTLGAYLIRKGVIPNLHLKSEIPFAPFLILGLLIVYFFGYNMFSVLEII